MATTAEQRRDSLRARLDSAVASVTGRFGFYVHALGEDAPVALRADEAFPAASVIKLPILLRLLEMVRDGRAALDDTVRLREWHKTGGSGLFQFFHEGLEVSLADACTAMIAVSDNTATNMILDVTGVDPVNASLDALGCRRTRLHRYFGKPDMPGPPGPSQAVPAEIGRLLELLLGGALLTPDLCRWALLLLRRQTNRTRIPRYLPEGTPVAHKDGSLDGVRHDAGVIWLPAGDGQRDAPLPDPMRRKDDDLPEGRPLVFVAMSRDLADLRWTVENEGEAAIGRAASLAYEHYSPPSSSSSSSSPPVTDSRIEK